TPERDQGVIQNRHLLAQGHHGSLPQGHSDEGDEDDGAACGKPGPDPASGQLLLADGGRHEYELPRRLPGQWWCDPGR
ncbi:MAG: hypothetical protein ACREJK_10080, partial [Candidatus Methylomirabilales bacterium]